MNIFTFLFGAFFLVLFLLFAVIVFFVVKMVKRESKANSPENIAINKENLLAKVQKEVSNLSPWQKNSHSAIAYKKGNKICSLEGEELIAFQYKYHATGLTTYVAYIYAATSQGCYDIDITEQEIVINYQDKCLGYVHGLGQEICNAKKQKIGQAVRPSSISVAANNLGVRKDMNYAIEFGGMHLADVNIKLGVLDEEEYYFKAPKRPKIIPILTMHGTASEQEKEWLVALALLECLFYAN